MREKLCNCILIRSIGFRKGICVRQGPEVQGCVLENLAENGWYTLFEVVYGYLSRTFSPIVFDDENLTSVDFAIIATKIEDPDTGFRIRRLVDSFNPLDRS